MLLYLLPECFISVAPNLHGQVQALYQSYHSLQRFSITVITTEHLYSKCHTDYNNTKFLGEGAKMEYNTHTHVSDVRLRYKTYINRVKKEKAYSLSKTAEFTLV